MRTPPAEVHVDEHLVRSLLADQHPDLSGRALARFAEGWDNSLWRLGDDLVVRLPRRALAAPLVLAEQRWLPELAATLPLPVPVPVRTGAPGRGFPWSWSIVRFLGGTPASNVPPLETTSAARALAGFLRALHVPAPADAPHNPYRGVALAERAGFFEERVSQLDDDLSARARDEWERTLRAKRWHDAPVWVHGDLHAANVLVERGELVGVVDFGDLAAGDPATDLASAWLLFATPVVGEVITAYGTTDTDLLARARGWALFFGVLLATIEDDAVPGLRDAGSASLRRLLDDVPARDR